MVGTLRDRGTVGTSPRPAHCEEHGSNGQIQEKLLPFQQKHFPSTLRSRRCLKSCRNSLAQRRAPTTSSFCGTLFFTARCKEWERAREEVVPREMLMASLVHCQDRCCQRCCLSCCRHCRIARVGSWQPLGSLAARCAR